MLDLDLELKLQHFLGGLELKPFAPSICFNLELELLAWFPLLPIVSHKRKNNFLFLTNYTLFSLKILNIKGVNMILK